MREKFLNSPGELTATPLCVSSPSTFILSFYSAIFCRQIFRTLPRNYKKVSDLHKSARNNNPTSTANSLFQNILRVSPSGSRFCGDSHRLIIHNINRMRILQNHEEKKWASWLGQLPGRAVPNKKGGPREAAFLIRFYRPQNRESLTPLGAGRVGSDIAKSVRPARGLGLIRCARPCGRPRHGRRLPWRTVRQFLAGAPD